MRSIWGAAFLLVVSVSRSSAQPDECLLGDVRPASSGGLQTCELFDAVRGEWVSPDDGLEDRARAYLAWLKTNHLPAGQVATTFFEDGSLSELVRWDDVGDSAMWTGTFLAAESLRYLTTHSPDARENVSRLVRTLHRLFAVTGSPGYIARFAVREDDDPRVVGLVDLTRAKRHRSVVDGVPHRWIGDTSRDQYQGVVMGLALAYRALEDEAEKNLIRRDLMTLMQELMRKQKQTIRIRWKIRGFEVVTKLKVDLQYVIRNHAEPLEVYIDLLEIEKTRFGGLQEFMPTIAGIPLFRRSGSAIMLLGMFHAALAVTRDAPGWQAAHAQIRTFYEQHANEWLDVADEWSYAYANKCWKDYYGININFVPAYTLMHLRQDPARHPRIARDVLLGRLWPVVDDHHNVFFSYVAAASQDGLDATWTRVVAHANAQLSQFPDAPRRDLPNDVRHLYPPSASCSGDSAIPIEVGHRSPADFLWQRAPFGLSSPGNEGKVFPGVDYLVAYWMARHHGFLQSNRPSVRTAWRSDGSVVP